MGSFEPKKVWENIFRGRKLSLKKVGSLRDRIVGLRKPMTGHRCCLRPRNPVQEALEQAFGGGWKKAFPDSSVSGGPVSGGPVDIHLQGLVPVSQIRPRPCEAWPGSPPAPPVGRGQGRGVRSLRCAVQAVGVGRRQRRTRRGRTAGRGGPRNSGPGTRTKRPKQDALGAGSRMLGRVHESAKHPVKAPCPVLRSNFLPVSTPGGGQVENLPLRGAMFLRCFCAIVKSKSKSKMDSGWLEFFLVEFWSKNRFPGRFGQF